MRVYYSEKCKETEVLDIFQLIIFYSKSLDNIFHWKVTLSIIRGKKKGILYPKNKKPKILFIPQGYLQSLTKVKIMKTNFFYETFVLEREWSPSI